ncbi:MAG: polysaccharide biosynthesis C-terminal domain-containing protein, partial [Clostridia bacterium]|nr:polysaccharide biosynthesis C-terminal domain-containing protein [Clostridia bacterium]
VTIFQNTDHIMLTNMVGEGENGFYKAAVTCATIAQFVYVAIIDSMRPVILAHKKDNDESYEKNLSRLYCIIIYLALAQAVGFTLFSNLIINILYGESYLASVPVLQILVWYMVFACIGSVRNVWILAENKQSMLWKINLAGALLNVLINSILIPFWGAAGAAFATLTTQIFTNLILGFIVKPLRANNKILIRGLNPKLLLDIFKK